MPNSYEDAKEKGWTSISTIADEAEAYNLCAFLKDRMPILTAVTDALEKGKFTVWCKSGLV